jgi:ribose 5-phosphate isomerase B
MRLAIANDHGGYELKMKLLPYLEEEEKLSVIDFGCFSTDIVRYPYYAAKVCNAVLDGEADKGILICSTGIGMSIAANKYKGIRAALCDNSYQGEMTARHNNSNVLCLGGRCISDLLAIDILKRWLHATYDGGRHDISLGLISDLESVNFTGDDWAEDPDGIH